MELDFYQPPVQEQWQVKVREDARNQIGSGLKKVLSEYDLECASVATKRRIWPSVSRLMRKQGLGQTHPMRRTSRYAGSFIWNPKTIT